MPDLLTHIMVAEGCRRQLGKGSLTAWFLVGTALPDLLTRPLTITVPALYWVLMPLHTPSGLLLVCVLISRCFHRRRQAQVFFNLTTGAALHLFLDAFQRHIGTGYYWLFPFAWSSYEIGLFWPETSVYLLPLWLGLAVFIVTRRLRRQRAGGGQLSPQIDL